jgi:DNA-binding MarR family transcriptional regulator
LAGQLKREIKQKKPFSGVHEEVVLAAMRTADLLQLPMNEVLRAAGLTQSQYNVLRILRGAADDGLPCGEISERMVRRDPDLTRLLDRLEARALVTRARGTADRRVVRALISENGKKLLDELDHPVDQSLRQALAHVPASRLKQLLEILDEIRSPR